MDNKKDAGQGVKDRLFRTLIELAGREDWPKLTVTELIEHSGVARASFYRNFKSVDDLINYGIERMAQLYHEGKPLSGEDFHSREAMIYNFRFYREYSNLVLSFHKAKLSTSLLDVITDCEINACGDMPVSSISRYELYFFSGAFYNMMRCWLENGARETHEAMADEFLRIVSGRK